ncbi:MAG TPA: DUF1361 domain-containing protein [Candidatus Saccharibacteria bacterium]|nr:DUF1361 domain-containing protein [Candidatus Saccharibacteria bacterium]
MIERKRVPFTSQVLLTLLASSAISMLLLGIRIMVTGKYNFWFLSWNLVLAWVPLIFALALRIRLFKHPFLSWQSLGLLIVWLGFLPNSFYLMSDLIHLQSSGDTIILFDIAMVMSFIINGLILGYMSIYIVHSLLRPRMTSRQSWLAVQLIFLASSFAIYLGRYLRWNTWDILFNPFGLIFDISERIINPVLHIQTYIVTFTFFIVLSATYTIIYQLAHVLSGEVKS